MLSLPALNIGTTLAIFSLFGKMPDLIYWFINEVKGIAMMSEMSFISLHDILSKPELDLGFIYIFYERPCFLNFIPMLIKYIIVVRLFSCAYTLSTLL